MAVASKWQLELRAYLFPNTSLTRWWPVFHWCLQNSRQLVHQAQGGLFFPPLYHVAQILTLSPPSFPHLHPETDAAHPNSFLCSGPLCALDLATVAPRLFLACLSLLAIVIFSDTCLPWSVICCETKRLAIANGWTWKHSGASTHHPNAGRLENWLSVSTPASWG